MNLPEKPQILAVKLGFNPNSSSIGIMVKIFLWGSLAISILLGVLSILVNLKAKKNNKQENTD